MHTLIFEEDFVTKVLVITIVLRKILKELEHWIQIIQRWRLITEI